MHRAYVLSDGETVDESIVAALLSGRPSGVFPAVRPPAPAPAAAEKSVRSGRPGLGRRRRSAPADPLSVPVRVGDSLEEVERRLLERTLAAVGGNKRKAAEMLRVSLKTVYNKIKQYELEL